MDTGRIVVVIFSSRRRAFSRPRRRTRSRPIQCFVKFLRELPLFEYELDHVDELNPKIQAPNYKWFDRLTTLSRVEG